MRSLAAILCLGLIILSSCHTGKPGRNTADQTSLRPGNLEPRTEIRLSNGILNAVFADNSAYGTTHRAGYNGIAELTHRVQDSSVFVPFYAGFNLEHIFGGDSLAELFEPRKHPMELFKRTDDEVLLYQSPTPFSGLESQTVFRLSDPHYIDVTFRFIIHEGAFFPHGYAGLFWASYIHEPADKRIYFRGITEGEDSVRWIAAYSTEHGLESTHLGMHDRNEIYFAPEFNARLASHFSVYRYEKPFYYGRFHNMVLAYMFKPQEGIRFSQSPTGGGKLNPAWDFQFIVPDFEVGREYSFQARIVYKEFTGEKDVLEEFKRWAAEKLN
jgi:hypothetical protein